MKNEKNGRKKTNFRPSRKSDPQIRLTLGQTQ